MDFSKERIECNELYVEFNHMGMNIKCCNRNIDRDRKHCERNLITLDILHDEAFLCPNVQVITNSGIPICCPKSREFLDGYLGHASEPIDKTIKNVNALTMKPVTINYYTDNDIYYHFDHFIVKSNECDLRDHCFKTKIRNGQGYEEFSEETTYDICPAFFGGTGSSLLCCAKVNVEEALKLK